MISSLSTHQLVVKKASSLTRTQTTPYAPLLVPHISPSNGVPRDLYQCDIGKADSQSSARARRRLPRMVPYYNPRQAYDLHKATAAHLRAPRLLVINESPTECPSMSPPCSMFLELHLVHWKSLHHPVPFVFACFVLAEDEDCVYNYYLSVAPFARAKSRCTSSAIKHPSLFRLALPHPELFR